MGGASPCFQSDLLATACALIRRKFPVFKRNQVGWGGKRKGAGRKPQPLEVPAGEDPLKFLISVMNDAGADPQLRVRAAIAAAQYTHNKRGEGGKKEERQEAADKVSGRFAPPASPKLVVNNA